MDNADEGCLVAFYAPQVVVSAIEDAARCSLLNRSAFIRQSIWRDLKREGWADDQMLAPAE